MSIATGDRLPDIELRRPTADGVETISTGEYFRGRRVVLFAVPGAFTSTCSEVHLPGFVVRSDDLKRLGIDEIACTSVNDAAVMGAWGRASGSSDHVTMLADGNGELAQALGLDFDGSRFGMGLRSRRYAAVVGDGIVEYLGVEDGPGVGVSGADAVLEALS